MVGKTDCVHHVDIESKQLKRECGSFVATVARDHVRLDAEDAGA